VTVGDDQAVRAPYVDFADFIDDLGATAMAGQVTVTESFTLSGELWTRL